MNIVFVKHYSGKDFAFRVPNELVPHIKKGDTVVVETMRGVTTGICQTGVISGDGALDVALAQGAYLPLKPVIGKSYPELQEVLLNGMRQKVIDLFDISELPF